MESLEKHNLLSLEKNKQENVMLDAMIKLAKSTTLTLANLT